MSDLFKQLGEYSDAITTLKETSYDSGNNEYMTELGLVVYSFDKIKEIYTRKLGKPEEGIDSVDALWILDSEKKLCFTEFKNGKIDNKDKQNARESMKDSLLIYFDIVGGTISYTRENAEFILVYNGEKKPLQDNEDVYDAKRGKVCKYFEARSYISGHLLDKAGEEYIRWGFHNYEGLYFRNVHTFDKEEFEEYVSKYIS